MGWNGIAWQQEMWQLVGAEEWVAGYCVVSPPSLADQLLSPIQARSSSTGLILQHWNLIER